MPSKGWFVQGPGGSGPSGSLHHAPTAGWAVNPSNLNICPTCPLSRVGVPGSRPPPVETGQEGAPAASPPPGVGALDRKAPSGTYLGLMKPTRPVVQEWPPRRNPPRWRPPIKNPPTDLWAKHAHKTFHRGVWVTTVSIGDLGDALQRSASLLTKLEHRGLFPPTPITESTDGWTGDVPQGQGRRRYMIGMVRDARQIAYECGLLDRKRVVWEESDFGPRVTAAWAKRLASLDELIKRKNDTAVPPFRRFT